MPEHEGTPTLTPETVALEILADVFVDLSVAFGRRDREGCAQVLREAEKRTITFLDGLLAELRAAGAGRSGGELVAAAAQLVGAAIEKAKAEVKKPPH